MPNQAPLFHTFPKTSKAEWLAKVEKDLKGRAIAELDWTPVEGITLPPFFTPEDGTDFPTISLDERRETWQVAEDFLLTPQPEQDNVQLLESLMGGVDAPRVIIHEEVGKDAWETFFKGVEWDYIHTHIRLGKGVNPASFQSLLLNYLEEKGKSEVSGSVLGMGFHPHFPMKTFGVDARGFHTGTAGIVEELAATLHHAVDMLTHQVDQGQAESAFRQTFFILQIDKVFFPALAKLRALRLLWARVAQGYGLPAIPLELEVEFSPKAYTEEAHTNMIRATTLAISAVLGGADRLVVRPAATQAPTGFHRRIARNVQHLLKMESFMDKVADPAAGSYYIEHLTLQMVEKAWERFLVLEDCK